MLRRRLSRLTDFFTLGLPALFPRYPDLGESAFLSTRLSFLWIYYYREQRRSFAWGIESLHGLPVTDTWICHWRAEALMEILWNRRSGIDLSLRSYSFNSLNYFANCFSVHVTPMLIIPCDAIPRLAIRFVHAHGSLAR